MHLKHKMDSNSVGNKHLISLFVKHRISNGKTGTAASAPAAVAQQQQRQKCEINGLSLDSDYELQTQSKYNNEVATMMPFYMQVIKIKPISCKLSLDWQHFVSCYAQDKIFLYRFCPTNGKIQAVNLSVFQSCCSLLPYHLCTARISRANTSHSLSRCLYRITMNIKCDTVFVCSFVSIRVLAFRLFMWLDLFT